MTTDMTDHTKPRRGTKPTKEIISDAAPNVVRTPKQQEIPQFEQDKILVIEAAADEYVEKRDMRMGLTKEETTAKDKLARLMHENASKIDVQDGTLAYTRGDYRIVISTTEKIKVKIGSDDDSLDGEEID